MRYFVSGEQQRKLLLNALVLMFLAYMFLQWISNGMMYFHRMDLTFDSVVTYYNGNEEQFIPAKSYDGMLEVLHFHLFSMGMLAVTLTHLMLMTEFSTRLKIWLSSLTFFSAIAEELAGWLVRFAHPIRGGYIWRGWFRPLRYDRIYYCRCFYLGPYDWPHSRIFRKEN